MRVVMTHPFCWPYVRRGTERNMDELARYLISRGHEVVTVSTRPERGGVEVGESGTRVLARTTAGPLLKPFRIDATHTFFFSSLRMLRTLDPDVVHSFYVTDGLAASYAHRRRRHPVVVQLNGAPVPGVSCRRWFPPEATIFRKALARADHRIACSEFVRELIRTHFRVDSEVIPPLVNVHAFPMGPGAPEGQPVILAAADFTTRRKGVRTLVKAFALLKGVLPSSILRLSGRVTPSLQQELVASVPPEVARSIEFLGLGQPGDLPRLYGTASITVLPSMWEPSGTVLAESWACGTPVVATRHGGLPEFVTPDVGVLFDPETDAEETTNARGLVDAMLDGLALAERPGVRLRCRRHAERYSWQAAGPRIERAYAGATSQ